MNDNLKKDQLKELLKKVSSDTSDNEMKKIKEEFKDIIKDANPLLIAQAEGELIKEGGKLEDLMKACDIHLELFKDVIRNPNLKVPEGHPIRDFQEDHKNILDLMEKLLEEVNKLKKYNDFNEAEESIKNIENLSQKLMEAENHNVRQENTLFPVLEKKGIEQPPAIMWHEHTEMKEEKKKLLNLLKNKINFEYKDFVYNLEVISKYLLEKFGSHTQKEENILYVTALNVITDEEWKEIKLECDALGYFRP
jgi:DUF438 domain-containing protein